MDLGSLKSNLLARAGKAALMAAGGVLVLAGILIAPLPGPFGLPIAVAGLVLILKNSYAAKRAFIRAQRARPKVFFPMRRLMRKRPEIAPVFWQQALRVEKMMLERAHRRLSRVRKTVRGAWRNAFAPPAATATA